MTSGQHIGIRLLVHKALRLHLQQPPRETIAALFLTSLMDKSPSLCHGGISRIHWEDPAPCNGGVVGV